MDATPRARFPLTPGPLATTRATRDAMPRGRGGPPAALRGRYGRLAA